MHRYWSSSPIGFIRIFRSPPKKYSDFSLFREFKARGRFWLPDKPNSSWWGEVFFQPGSYSKLTLDESPWQDSPRRGIDIPVLNGRLSDGTLCTFFECVAYVNTIYTDKSYNYAKVHCRYLFLGENFKSINEKIFVGLGCQFTHLNTWFGSPYELKHDRSHNRSLLCFNPIKFSISVESKGIMTCVEIACNRNVPFEIKSAGDNWNFDYLLIIRPSEAQNLEWYLNTATSLRRLLIFLIGNSIYTLDLSPIFSFSEEKGKPFDIDGRLLQEVDIPSFVRDDSHYFSTHYSKIAEKLPEIMQKWFKEEELLSVVINNYTNTLLGEGVSEELVFLGIVQTLEHFHEILFPKNCKNFNRHIWRSLSSDLHTFIIQKLKNLKIPKEQLEEKKDVLVNRIGFLNSVSLQSKLAQLVREIPRPELMPLLHNPRKPDEDIKVFLKKICDTRNYLVHPKEGKKEDVLIEIKLLHAISSLWAILTYWLAIKLDFSPKDASDMAMHALEAMFISRQKTGL